LAQLNVDFVALRELVAERGQLDDAALLRLGDVKLTRVQLAHNQLEGEGPLELISNGVRDLELDFNPLAKSFPERLARAAALPHLERLSLLHTGLQGSQVSLFSGELGALRELRVDATSKKELATLASRPLPMLRRLTLRSCLGPDDVAALIRAPWFPQLTDLDLRDNQRLGDTEVRAVAEASGRLRLLDLRGCEMTEAGGDVLLEMPNLKGCRILPFRRRAMLRT
jgi:hypothetical protein